MLHTNYIIQIYAHIVSSSFEILLAMLCRSIAHNLDAFHGMDGGAAAAAAVSVFSSYLAECIFIFIHAQASQCMCVCM